MTLVMSFVNITLQLNFGQVLEEIIGRLLFDMGYINLSKDVEIVLPSGKKKKMKYDQYFTNVDRSQYFLIEQKVRDDHDSSKKSGQIENFRKKLEYLKMLHNTSLTGIMYFIDPSLHKNQAFYKDELIELSDEFGIPALLFYDGELFEFLDGNISAWSLLQDSLLMWRSTVREEINLNYDMKPEDFIHETQSISPSIWYKLLANDLL